MINRKKDNGDIDVKCYSCRNEQTIPKRYQRGTISKGIQCKCHNCLLTFHYKDGKISKG